MLSGGVKGTALIRRAASSCGGEKNKSAKRTSHTGRGRSRGTRTDREPDKATARIRSASGTGAALTPARPVLEERGPSTRRQREKVGDVAVVGGPAWD